MIVDLILNRKDGVNYRVENFYRQVANYGEIGFDITEALDNGEEFDVKRELCNYIKENGYNSNINNYINNVEWLNK